MISVLFSDSSFWLLLSFLGFLIFFGRPLYRKTTKHLETHGKSVEEALLDAQNIFYKAESLYHEALERHENQMLQVEEIFALMNERIVSLHKKKNTEMSWDASLKEALLKERLQHLQAKIHQQVKDFLVNKAFEKAHKQISNANPDLNLELFFSILKKSLK